MVGTVFLASSIDIRKGKGLHVQIALTNFKKIYEVCDLHTVRESHTYDIALYDAFVERMSGKRESVLIQLREGVRETIQNCRKKLYTITEIIVLCSWQNIALRGHHDSGIDMEGIHAQLSSLGLRHYLEGPPSECS